MLNSKIPFIIFCQVGILKCTRILYKNEIINSNFIYLIAFVWEPTKDTMFDDPQIRELMKDPMIDEARGVAELSAWQSLKSVVTKFLGNYQSAGYEKEIEELQKIFRQLGARMSVKLHFLRSHLDYFPKNYKFVSKEQVSAFTRYSHHGRALPRLVGCKLSR